MWPLGREDGLRSKILFFPRAAGRKRAVGDLGGLPLSLGRTGSLEVRLATSKKEIRKAQRLRYKVFYEQGQATADRRSGLVRRDICPFDRVCDHLLVIDHSSTNRFGRTLPRVASTTRLLRQDIAVRNFGFYTAREFDIGPLIARHAGDKFLELGRSCVLPEYRSKRTLELLWRGIWAYVRHHHIDVMIGCASLEGAESAGARAAAELSPSSCGGRRQLDGARPEAALCADGSSRQAGDRHARGAGHLAAAGQGLSAPRGLIW